MQLQPKLALRVVCSSVNEVMPESGCPITPSCTHILAAPPRHRPALRCASPHAPPLPPPLTALLHR
eukprot:scaffold36658_cov68-Phaeocystis_antarctica.AAC.4